MIRKAFKMFVHPGQHAEYARRHQPIWPELEQTLLAHGVQTYSIFLDGAANELFAYVEFADEKQWNAIAQTDVCRHWWRHMRELMPSHPDDTPKSVELGEVFHIENRAG